jgi:DNA invertase Pin-like site-specific DNA recombinase
MSNVRNLDRPREHLAGRAVQYVRMSTDKQKYSIQHQVKLIGEYAGQRGLTIVRSYEDEGFRISGRNGLKVLIEDVRSGGADFDHVLVYDVSRWGPLSGCRRERLLRIYLLEGRHQAALLSDEFENDGSLASTILKNVKRLMAGEYSRQLSRRIFLSQCWMAESGLWRGGAAGYGLRRQLVDVNGQPIRMPERGRHKSISTERVILRPGPSSEIAVIRRIFNLSSAPDDLPESHRQDETRRKVGLGHSSNGPSWIELAEIRVSTTESRFVACLNRLSQQNRPKPENIRFE